MKIRSISAAALLVASAGLAAAQPATIDGVNDMTEPYVLLWENDTATGFGDNEPGEFTGGDFGDPPGDVTTGVEIAIPLADLGLTGTETAIRFAGWVNSGDRTFKSNQIFGDLPLDTTNIGGAGTDFTVAPFDATTQHVTVDLSAQPTFTPSIDGTRDAGYATADFLQGNFTGFGNETDGTEDGDGPNGGGSEIDALYVAKDATNLYLFVAGNLEFNGNGLDIYIDTPASGSSLIGTGTGSGGFIVNGQTGTAFDATMDADYLISVDAFDDDTDGLTPNVPRAFAGPLSGDIDLLGNLAGYGAANGGALANGDAGAPAASLAIDNSNTLGVIGSASAASPTSPDANWAYGSEFNNLWAYIDSTTDTDGDTLPNDTLYVLVGGNVEINANKANFFLDVDGADGQNQLRGDNVDISFNGLNRMGNSDQNGMPPVLDGLTFDAGFAPDYWFNVNTNVDGSSGNLQNFTDAAVLRAGGPLVDGSSNIVDYGAFFGGQITDGVGIPVAMPVELMDFSGPQLDLPTGGQPNTQYAPRTAQTTIENNPFATEAPAGLLQTAIDNSNVDGVNDTGTGNACEVTTGIEIAIDLDEAGWDGISDIRIAGYITSAGFDFLSNQVLGGVGGLANLGDPRGNAGGMPAVPSVDFGTISGDQFVNITTGLLAGGIACNPSAGCPCDVEGDGDLDPDDINAFVVNFTDGIAGNADIDGDGDEDPDDIAAFVSCFTNPAGTAGCESL